jgi:hypothetical protein
MAVHHCRTKASAKRFAAAKRARGFNASVSSKRHPKKKAYGVYVTRK